MTTLAFAQDLGDVIGTGIANAATLADDGSESKSDIVETSPAKQSFNDVRERRKLGKRILKAVQPLLETALRVESEISNKPYESLHKELETLIEASVGATTSTKQEDRDEDTIMVDAQDTSQITVKSHLDAGDADGEAMDMTADAEIQNGGNIEVNTSALGITVRTEKPATAQSPRKSKRGKGNALQTSETPPESEGYVNVAPAVQAGPPTPPQSNGSFGKEPTDPLTEGGVFWYLRSMQPQGTSIIGETWAAGRNAVRMLSEELTDLDDEELKGLRAEVDESVKAAGLDLNGILDGGTTKTNAAASKTRKRRTSGRRR